MCDAWAAVRAALSKDAGDSTAPALVCVCFVHRWLPPAQKAEATLSTVRDQQRVSNVRVHIVDADADVAAMIECGVRSTPATVFYWLGQPLQVYRPGWQHGNIVYGDFTQEQWEDILRHLRQCAVTGATPTIDY